MMIRVIFSLLFIANVFAANSQKTMLRIALEPVAHYGLKSSRISHANGVTTLNYRPITRNFGFGIMQPVFKNTALCLEVQSVVWSSYYVHDYDLVAVLTSDNVDHGEPFEIGKSDRLFGHSLFGPSFGVSYLIDREQIAYSRATIGVFWGYKDEIWHPTPYLRYEISPINRISSLMLAGQTLLIPEDGFIYSIQLSFTPNIIFWK